MRQCHAPACPRGTTGYSRFCEAHRARDRRHGHPEQLTITAKRLAPYAKTLRAHIAKRGGDALWAKLEAIWGEVVGQAHAIITERQTGRPMVRNEVQAAQVLVSVAEAAPARRIIETVAGMWMLAKCEPRAFRSDRAVWIQTARRFRNLSDVSVEKHWNAKEGRLKRTYRNFPPHAGESLGKMLLTGIGVIGAHVLKGEEEEAKRLFDAKRSAQAALEGPASASG